MNVYHKELKNSPDFTVDDEVLSAIKKAADFYSKSNKETAGIHSGRENLVELRYWNYTGRTETITTSEDISHYILMVLLCDKKRPKAEFLNRYIWQRIRDIRRKRNAKKRNAPVLYFEDGIYDEKNRFVPLEAILSVKTDSKTRKLIMDVRRVVSNLGGEMRQLCDLIMDNADKKLIKKTMRLTDLKLKILKKELLEYFLKHRLDRYLRHSKYLQKKVNETSVIDFEQA
jgi:hypothetical protein